MPDSIILDGAIIHTVKHSMENSSGSKTPAIQFENLTRKFDNVIAVDNINLSIPKGCFFGFLGPNGAGKSTTINMLIGLIKPTSGKILVLGHDISKQRIDVKRMLGIVPEHLNLYDRLKGREYLEFSGALYGLKREEAISRTREILSLLEIDGEKFITDLSLGMKKKVSLGAALLHKPRILILDEPFTSVDAISARKIKDILQTMTRSGVTIFMSSHIMEIIERLCNQVAIIHYGKILLSGSTQELLRGERKDTHHTLEEVFVDIVGVDSEGANLSWIK